MTTTERSLSKGQARALWIRAQRLDEPAPFGAGPEAVQRAIEHLGYVQIDTIHVVERAHHHILYNRVPDYRPRYLERLQSVEKSVFEYWTHALAYVPVRDYGFFRGDMRKRRLSPSRWYQSVQPSELRKVLRNIRREGPLSIRDIEDDVLVEKDHPWASRKPSKRALQLAFYGGRLVVSERVGATKKYELTDRHFGWTAAPKRATEREIARYLLERGLRAQAIVSLDSLCYLDAPRKAAVRKAVEAGARKGELFPIRVEGLEKTPFWMRAEDYEAAGKGEPLSGRIHILSPFDPLLIQRKRLAAFFGYEHRFEAYLPKEKRTLGYFALPVLAGDRIVAALDLKTDRVRKKLRVQQWTWIGKAKTAALKAGIETELDRFERFQIGNEDKELG